MFDYQEEADAIRNIQAGQTSGWDVLCRMHAGLAYRMSKVFRRRYPQNEIEDYLQECRVAILETAQSFDWGRGVKFSTWLTWNMRRRLQETACSAIIRVPRKSMSKTNTSKTVRDRTRHANTAARLNIDWDWGMFDGLEDNRHRVALLGAEWLEATELHIHRVTAAYVLREYESSYGNPKYNNKIRAVRRLPRLMFRASRMRAIVWLRLCGYTLEAVAAIIGITCEAVRLNTIEFIRLDSMYRAEVRCGGRQVAG